MFREYWDENVQNDTLGLTEDRHHPSEYSLAGSTLWPAIPLYIVLMGERVYHFRDLIQSNGWCARAVKAPRELPCYGWVP